MQWNDHCTTKKSGGRAWIHMLDGVHTELSFQLISISPITGEWLLSSLNKEEALCFKVSKKNKNTWSKMGSWRLSSLMNNSGGHFLETINENEERRLWVTHIMSSALQLWSSSSTSSRLCTTTFKDGTKRWNRPGWRRGRTFWQYSTEALKTRKWHLLETNDTFRLHSSCCSSKDVLTAEVTKTFIYSWPCQGYLCKNFLSAANLFSRVCVSFSLEWIY